MATVDIIGSRESYTACRNPYDPGKAACLTGTAQPRYAPSEEQIITEVQGYYGAGVVITSIFGRQLDTPDLPDIYVDSDIYVDADVPPDPTSGWYGDCGSMSFKETVKCTATQAWGWTESTGQAAPWTYTPPAGWMYDPAYPDERAPGFGSHGGCPNCIMTLVHLKLQRQGFRCADLPPWERETDPRCVSDIPLKTITTDPKTKKITEPDCRQNFWELWLPECPEDEIIDDKITTKPKCPRGEQYSASFMETLLGCPDGYVVQRDTGMIDIDIPFLGEYVCKCQEGKENGGLNKYMGIIVIAFLGMFLIGRR